MLDLVLSKGIKGQLVLLGPLEALGLKAIAHTVLHS